ncbi:MAG: ABC transporter substrate binding protein [Mariprofundaceae bacterium]|nr:ABC transporter substrate binding protein [Mariprofundaceae bacterium]
MRFIILISCYIVMTCSAQAKECIYINSYHAGYAWSDKIEAVVKDKLKDACNVHVFRMDTKRHTSAAFGRQKALEAKALIEEVKPDVVIVSDDNASKYLVAPYYKNSSIPFVFCGINWTAKAYGYPYDNATGMIEVAPIKALLREARLALGEITQVAFIATKGVRTDEKEFVWISRIYAREGITVIAFYVDSMKTWKKAYAEAQSSDFIMLNNIAGIADWDKETMVDYVTHHAKTLTVSTYDFMTPYTMLAMTKLAEEQGEWASDVALHILQGVSPKDIPVVANRRYNLYINTTLLDASHVQLSENLYFKAIKIQ